MNTQNTNLYGLKTICEANRNSSLLFRLGEATIHPNYHITEIKHAVVNSMDCGQGTDQWDEIIVQLLDGSAHLKGKHMSCAKFIGIVGTALESLASNENSETYIEFAPNNEALRKLVIESIEQTENEVIVNLSNPTAMCKPFQRAMAKQTASAQSDANCCATPALTKQSRSCCGNDETSRTEGASCC